MVICLRVGVIGGQGREKDLGLFTQTFNNWSYSKINCYLIVESAKLLEILKHKLDDHLRME